MQSNKANIEQAIMGKNAYVNMKLIESFDHRYEQHSSITRFTTILSGVGTIAGCVGMAFPRTRVAGAIIAASSSHIVANNMQHISMINLMDDVIDVISNITP
jgi:hypothetical protein